MSVTRQTWDTTREPNLLRNTASGRYYGRFTLAGKQKWINLETDVWTVAKLRLADERAKIERLRQTATNVTAGWASMGDLVTLYKDRIEDRVDIKAKTKRRLREEVGTIAKTWPGFLRLAPSQLTRQAVLEWRNRISRDGTGFVVPGAKKVSLKINGSSASLINKCIDALRRMLDIAVERGQLAGNPLYPRGLKLKNTPRKPNLPEAAKLSEIFSEIERAGGGFSRNAVNFCRFLAYTGCRLSEAQGVTWGDVDFKRGILHVRGSKTEAANREVPLIPAAKALLERLYSARQLAASASIEAGRYRTMARTHIDDLAVYGIFVVSVGEVECWLHILGVNAPKKDWLEKMFERLGSDPNSAAYVEAGADDVWQFLDSIATWIKNPDRLGIP